jgi:hypothetical protein
VSPRLCGLRLLDKVSIVFAIAIWQVSNAIGFVAAAGTRPKRRQPRK